MASENFEEFPKKDEKIIKKSTYNMLIIIVAIAIGIAIFFAGSYTTNLNSDKISQEELDEAIAKLELKIFQALKCYLSHSFTFKIIHLPVNL